MVALFLVPPFFLKKKALKKAELASKWWHFFFSATIVTPFFWEDRFFLEIFQGQDVSQKISMLHKIIHFQIIQVFEYLNT